MVYNDTNITAANNLLEMFEAVNQLTDGIMIAVLMLVLAITIFVVFNNYPKKVVLLVDSFLMSLIGILFFTLGWIGWTILFAPIFVLFLSVLFYFFIPD